MTAKPKIRCAIYARTSTEEGLAQEFNSLDAQIESCRAYIVSQAGEGWIACKQTFVDGGFSGGSLERPALQRLLAALTAREIDVIVVYKVDRLTRSLADFAKIVETLDRAGASFVSITQSFNTTTSMGRLTLNVLLSFAQFEREVTAERIRDKIAASKAKGMWMGGPPPLGYDVKDRHLIVNEIEAQRVRFIYRQYLELKSIGQLAQDLVNRGVLSKGWTSLKGRIHQSTRISEGALTLILTNPHYRGLIAHRGKTYPGRHEAIIDEDLWNAVQARRAAIKTSNATLPSKIDAPFLIGKLKDDAGNTMRVDHARKGERRYRYYVSSALLDGKGKPGGLARVSTGALDRAVMDATAPLLASTWLSQESIEARLRSALILVEVAPNKLRLHLTAEALDACALSNIGASVTQCGNACVLEHPITLARPRNATVIIGGVKPAARVDRTLVRAIALARGWADQLENRRRSVSCRSGGGAKALHPLHKSAPAAGLSGARPGGNDFGRAATAHPHLVRNSGKAVAIGLARSAGDAGNSRLGHRCAVFRLPIPRPRDCLVCV
ncbi:MAG: recombinase family protein [Terricaulis sp.]